MRPPFSLQTSTAVVTGAASGLGRALAVELASRGCRLALVDTDAPGLEVIGARLRSRGPTDRVTLHVVDISDAASVNALPDVVLRGHGTVDLLINNAAVSHSGPFEETLPEDFEWVMRTNFWGAAHCCRAFLPQLRTRERAQIVNILSMFALAGFPGKSAYGASKAALRSLSESLRAELRDTPVGVTEAYPPAMDTPIVQRGRVAGGTTEADARRAAESRFLQSHSMPIDRVARRIVNAAIHGRSRVRIGATVVAFDLAARVSPLLANYAIGRFRKRLPFG